MINFIKRHLPKQLKLLSKWLIHCVTFDSFMLRSYSQEGEDMILRRLFEKQKKGFYVDVGAHHPKRFSNTLFSIKKGGAA